MLQCAIARDGAPQVASCRLRMHSTVARQDSADSDLDIVFQVVAGALSAAEQVACVEGVVHVPPNAAGGIGQVAHTKLLPFQQRRMEVAQRKDDGPELSLQDTLSVMSLPKQLRLTGHQAKLCLALCSLMCCAVHPRCKAWLWQMCSAQNLPDRGELLSAMQPCASCLQRAV